MVVHVFLDISRLLTAAKRGAPSGIDRVELAYARRWAAMPDGSATFVAEIPLIGFSALPATLVRELIAGIAQAWDHGGRPPNAIIRRVRMAQPFGRGALTEALKRPGPKVFLLVSHRALERPAQIAAMRRQGCHFVPLIHDLIPLHHPEFARAGQAETHRRRIVTTAALADAIVVNSAATAAELTPWLADRIAAPPIAVEAPPVALRPYFVVLGTIEPRKNHMLLLNMWRNFATTLGPAAPRLVVVGRRGWENENVLDMLERCTALDGLVREAGMLPDREVASLLRGARALLFPSFAEGFGLPLAEALALGVPAIASDLAALREVGQQAPDYIDPLDGASWRNAVLDYARPDSPGRRAQVARLATWQPPSWDRHFAEVDRLLDRLSGTPILVPSTRPAPRALRAQPASAHPRDEAQP